MKKAKPAEVVIAFDVVADPALTTDEQRQCVAWRTF